MEVSLVINREKRMISVHEIVATNSHEETCVVLRIQDSVYPS